MVGSASSMLLTAWVRESLHSGLEGYSKSKRLWSWSYIVVCILVRVKSFPRFWRNHSYCRNKWYLIWMGCLFSLRWSKKKSKWLTQKNLIFQLCQFSIFFMKIPWIGPWVSRIDWCEGHGCGSIYIVMRLSDISSKTA